MMSSESMISLDFGSESTKSSIICDYCHSKIDNNSDHVEVFFKFITTQNNNESENNHDVYFNLHKTCSKYSFDNLNNLNEIYQDNKKYLNKYWNNVKKNCLHISTLLMFLILIIGIILYDCYSIINTENYLGTQISYCYDCSYCLTEWFYKIHVLVIINILIQFITCFTICFKLILLVFY